MPNEQVDRGLISPRSLSDDGNLHVAVVVVHLLLLSAILISIRPINNCRNLSIAYTLGEELSSLRDPW
jgi:hypothetical protein